MIFPLVVLWSCPGVTKSTSLTVTWCSRVTAPRIANEMS